MASLDDYAMLVRIMDAGSLTSAAKQSRHSVQNVSRALARIEAENWALLWQKERPDPLLQHRPENSFCFV
jgi:DNA-binding transcriptional LysR family regulator